MELNGMDKGELKDIREAPIIRFFFKERTPEQEARLLFWIITYILYVTFMVAVGFDMILICFK